jgi:uncharacterized HAD superfamily protein
VIIASDIDGVIADIEPEINRRISEQFGVEINDIKKDKFYMHERFDIEPVVMETFLQERVFNDDEFWLAATPMHENIDALKRIAVLHPVVLITGRHNHARAVTEDWLIEHAGFISYDALLMQSLQVKHRAMKFAGAEVMIEDRYAEAATIASQGHRSYVVERHYNVEHKEKDDGVIWVKNILEVAELEGLI